ncbi:MAG: cation diffusion facilitator family transporter [Syntrophobacteraceae bacterium]
MERRSRAEARYRVLAISASLATGILIMGLKFYTYRITQSSAILSDALESIINVVASAFALGSILIAAKPPDPSHPYGHGKIEYFSAGFEGALIVLAAAGILHQGWHQLVSPHDLADLGSGLLLLVVTSLMNAGLAIALIRVGKRTRSLVLIADGKHVLTDVYSSIGVLGGLFLVHRTGLFWLDGAIACLMAVSILVTGAKLIRQSYAGLMDASDPELLEEISLLIAKYRRPTWIDIHKLRAWRSGNQSYVDFHLILPRDLSLEEAHREVMDLRTLLQNDLTGIADTLIHAEPCIDPECPICGYDPCKIRQNPTRHQRLWRRETLVSDSKQDRGGYVESPPPHASDTED